MLDRIQATSQPPASVPLGASAAYAAAVDGMLDESTRPEERALALEACTAYRLDLVEMLHERGYKIAFKDDMSINTGGLHVETKKEIHVNRKWARNDHKRVLIHEMAHGIDFQRHRDKTTWLSRALWNPAQRYDSQTDPALERLYQQYQLRSAVDVAAHARDEINKFPTALSRTNYFGRTIENTRGTNEAGRETITETSRDDKGGNMRVTIPLVMAALQGAGAVAVGFAAPLLAPLMAAGAGVALWSSWAGKRELAEERRFDAVSGNVPLANGTTLKVSSEGETRTVETPPAGHKDEYDWSDYAARTRKVIEYYAEAVAFYLASPVLREKLQTMDPDMYAYIKAQGLGAQDAGPGQRASKNPAVAGLRVVPRARIELATP